MTEWLDPIRLALEENTKSIAIFFRDDDAGWCDERLFPLLDLFNDYDVPVDLAVIPQELRPTLAVRLRKRVESFAPRLGVHQHGFRHQNYEFEGRKYEFGDARTPEQQFRDLANGKRLLHGLLGDLVEPVFTPPWNRCNQATVDALVALGFKVLSRDLTARRLDLRELVEVPVTVDWLRRLNGKRVSRIELGMLIAEQVQAGKPIGIMLHHAGIDLEERTALAQLLNLLSCGEQVQFSRITGLVGSEQHV